MKKLLFYLTMLSMAIAINSCEKETFEPDNFVGTIEFKDGLSNTVNFTLSLDKTSYAIGETITARVAATRSILFSSSYYDGTLTMKSTGSGNVLFSYSYSGVVRYNLPSSYTCLQEPSGTSLLCLSNILSVKIPPETLPGEYNATLSITKTSDLFGLLITNTKKVSIPFEIK